MFAVLMIESVYRLRFAGLYVYEITYTVEKQAVFCYNMKMYLRRKKEKKVQ